MFAAFARQETELEGFVESIGDWIEEWGPRLLVAAIILVIGAILIRIARRLVSQMLARRDLDPAATSFVGSLVAAVLWVAVFITIIGYLGIPTTSFVAILGALGLAVGLALQDNLANFAAGVLILTFKPFVSGEYIEAQGLAGTVDDVQIVATTLITPDNRNVVIPNAQLWSGPITNYSRQDTRRVDFVFGIGYDDDLARAKQILEEKAASDPRVLSDPEPTIAVLNLGDSTVDIAARIWVDSDDYWPLFFDWTEQIKLAFDESGISIPYPQTDVHLIDTEQKAS